MASKRFVVTSALFAALVGCGGSTSPAEAPAAAPEPVPPPQQVAAEPAHDELAVLDAKLSGVLTAAEQALHERAIAAAKAGHWAEAKRLLAYVLFSEPKVEPLREQYNLAAARYAQSTAAITQAIGAALRTVATPPTTYSLVRRGPGDSASVRALQKASEKPNKITDLTEWLERHDLRLNAFAVPPVNDTVHAPADLTANAVAELAYPPGGEQDLSAARMANPRKAYYVLTPELEASRLYVEAGWPEQLPLAYGALVLQQAFASNGHVLAFYGPYSQLGVVYDSTHKVVGALDLSAFRDNGAQAPLELRHAEVADGVLYLSQWHNGYTKEVKGQSGYVSAIELASGELLWRSAPQVCNVHNFVLEGGAVVCGYGFTSESRWVTVTDRATGVTAQKLKVSTTPETWVKKGDELYVHGYRADFVFRWK